MSIESSQHEHPLEPRCLGKALVQMAIDHKKPEGVSIAERETDWKTDETHLNLNCDLGRCVAWRIAYRKNLTERYTVRNSSLGRENIKRFCVSPEDE